MATHMGFAPAMSARVTLVSRHSLGALYRTPMARKASSTCCAVLPAAGTPVSMNRLGPRPVTMALLLRTLARGAGDAVPFVLTLAMIFLAYSGLGISVWPNVIPPDISIWAAAGPPQSLGFSLVGALLIVPVILMYTAWGYWVFRGKVHADTGYH